MLPINYFLDSTLAFDRRSHAEKALPNFPRFLPVFEAPGPENGFPRAFKVMGSSLEGQCVCKTSISSISTWKRLPGFQLFNDRRHIFKFLLNRISSESSSHISASPRCVLVSRINVSLHVYCCRWKLPSFIACSLLPAGLSRACCWDLLSTAAYCALRTAPSSSFIILSQRVCSWSSSSIILPIRAYPCPWLWRTPASGACQLSSY